MKKFSYVGPINNKQLKFFIANLRSEDLTDSSFIGPSNLSSKFKLRQIIRYAEEYPDHEHYVDNVLENIANGNEFEEEPMQLVVEEKS